MRRIAGLLALYAGACAATTMVQFSGECTVVSTATGEVAMREALDTRSSDVCQFSDVTYAWFNAGAVAFDFSQLYADADFALMSNNDGNHQVRFQFSSYAMAERYYILRRPGESGFAQVDAFCVDRFDALGIGSAPYPVSGVRITGVSAGCYMDPVARPSRVTVPVNQPFLVRAEAWSSWDTMNYYMFYDHGVRFQFAEDSGVELYDLPEPSTGILLLLAAPVAHLLSARRGRRHA